MQDPTQEHSQLHLRELSPAQIHELASSGALDLGLLLQRDLWDGRTHVRRNAAAAACHFEDIEHPRAGLLCIAARDSDAEVREYAATAIGRLRLSPQEATGALLRGLVDKVAPVAEAALQSLERLMLQRPAEIAPLLVPALVDPRAAVRIAAREVLLRGGPHAVRPLIAGMGSGDDTLAATCLELADRLGGMTTDAAIEALADPVARARAAALLRHHPPRSSSQKAALEAMAKVKDASTSQLARQLVNELAQFSRRPAPDAPPPHPDFSTRLLETDTLQALAASQPPSALLRAALSGSGFSRINTIRALELGAGVSDWAEALAAFMADADPEVRRTVADSAGNRSAKEAAAPLARLLADGAPEVREAAAASLSRLAVTAPDAALGAAAATPPQALAFVQETLAQLPDVALGPLVRQGLVSPQGATRLLIASALRQPSPRGREVIDALVRALTDPLDPVRVAAAEALGQCAEVSPEAMAALDVAALDPVAAVRRAAYIATSRLRGLPLPGKAAAEASEEPVVGFFSEALAAERLGSAAAEIGPAALAGFLRDGRPAVRRNAAVALGALGPQAGPAVGALEAALRDEDPTVRQAVVAALSALAASSAHERSQALVGALHDRSPAVREAAERVLEGLGARALDALIEAFDQDPGFVRGYIFPLVARLGQPSVEALLASLTHSSPQRRAMGCELLGRVSDFQHARTRKTLEAAQAADPDAQVKASARRALRQLTTKDEARRLAEAVPLPAAGFEERLMAAAELEKAKKKLREEALLALLSDGRAIVRANAATAVGAVQSPTSDAAQALALRLKDSEPMVRLAAAQALGKLGEVAAPAVPTMLGALRSAGADLEDALVGALAPLMPAVVAALPDFLRQRPEVALPALGRLAQRRPDLLAAPLALAAAEAPSVLARENAVDILTLLGFRAAEAESGLLAALGESEVLLRCKAARALALTAPPSAELQQRLIEVGETDPHLAVKDAVEAALRILKARARQR